MSEPDNSDVPEPMPRASVEDVLSSMTNPDINYYLHRGCLEHKSDPHRDCWCSPLALRMEQVHSHKQHELQAVLDSFYQVH